MKFYKTKRNPVNINAQTKQTTFYDYYFMKIIQN